MDRHRDQGRLPCERWVLWGTSFCVTLFPSGRQGNLQALGRDGWGWRPRGRTGGAGRGPPPQQDSADSCAFLVIGGSRGSGRTRPAVWGGQKTAPRLGPCQKLRDRFPARGPWC